MQVEAFCYLQRVTFEKIYWPPPLYNAAVRDSTEVVRSLLARKYRQDLDDTGGGLSFLTMQRNI